MRPVIYFIALIPVLLVVAGISVGIALGLPAGSLLGTTVVAGLVGTIAVERLQRRITHTIGELIHAARQAALPSGAGVRVEVPAHGELGALVQAFNDMIDTIHARDAALLQQRESLEEDVSSRTLDLMRLNEQLRGAMQKAEEGAHAKTQFLANMSHEIRTPLNGIIGMTELALGTELPDEARDHLQIVRTSASTLLHIINDVLDFAKIDAGKLSIERVDFDLRALLEESIEPLRVGARQRGLTLTLDYSTHAPQRVTGDPTRIRQIVTNLCSNAIKFTPTGNIDVSIEVLVQRPGSTQLRCTVQDSGIGIEADKLPRLFEKFTQADASTTRRYGGTGLGLAISKLLVELMDGSIHVESMPGKGSRFWFDLTLPVPVARPVGSGDGSVPRDGRTAGAPTSAPVAVAPTTETEPPLEPVHVLVVEDNPVNQKVATLLLGKMGCTTMVASNGQEGVEMTRSGCFDVILMDCQMPVMDGYQAAGEIRRLPGPASRTPIVAMTAHALPGDREKCLQAGMDDYLAKPVRGDDLRLVLGRWVSRLAGYVPAS